ncbi:MAG: 1-phosphofructokinase [Lachnospiraceae bacterium]|nr:1-phosphofructokinase [Lachnospiraceae bacterium]
MIYTVTFNPALDYVVHPEGPIVEGEVNRSLKEEFYYGGKGINVSMVLNSLGVDSIALGFIAGFTGFAIERGIRRKGIQTDFIMLEGGISRINVKIRQDKETAINTAGPRICNDDVKALIRKIDAMEDGDYLVLAGSVPSNMHSDIYERIMRRIEGKGIKVILDAEGELLTKALPLHPFLIKPNRAELGRLFDAEIEDDDDVKKYAKELQKMGAQNVLVSLGADGAILVPAEGKVKRIGVPEGRVINTVGSGDSMIAGFLAGYLKNSDMGKALNLATAAASATAISEGLGEKSTIMMQLEKINNGFMA